MTGYLSLDQSFAQSAALKVSLAHHTNIVCNGIQNSAKHQLGYNTNECLAGPVLTRFSKQPGQSQISTRAASTLITFPPQKRIEPIKTFRIKMVYFCGKFQVVSELLVRAEEWKNGMEMVDIEH